MKLLSCSLRFCLLALILSSCNGTGSGSAALPVVSIENTGPVAETDAKVRTPFTVTLSKTSAQNIVVDYSISAGTASTSDYSSDSSGTISIASGATSATISVDIIGDDLYESDETFDIRLSNPVNAILGIAYREITIKDDESPPVVSLERDSLSFFENAGSIDVSVLLSAPSALSTQVDYLISSGTASTSDYSADSSGTISIASGATSATISVDIIQDNMYESDETFDIRLSNPVNANLGNSYQIITIHNDASPPVVSLERDSLSVVENAGSIDVSVLLSAPSALSTQVDYLISSGTASTSDYSADSSGTISIASGATSATISVDIIQDNMYESDETFDIRLSNPVNANLGTSSQIITIHNDASPPVVSLERDSLSVVENAGSIDVSVLLSAPSALSTQFDYLISSGTASTSDYSADRSGTISIASGATSATISVDIIQDNMYESDETFDIRLSEVTNAIIDLQRNYQILTITNDDPKPAVTFATATSTTSETDSINIQVNLSAVSGIPGQVHYAVSFSTAVVNDFAASAATSGLLTFVPGETSNIISLDFSDDSLYELDESFDIVLSNPVGAILGTNVIHRAVITSQDAKPGVGFASVSSSVTETNSNQMHSIEVSLSQVSGADTNINYLLDFGSSDQSADSGDLSPSSGNLRIPSGQRTGNIVLTIAGDEDKEQLEVAVVRLVSADNANITGITTHSLYIMDDDPDILQVISVELNQGQAITARDTVSVRFVATNSDINISHYLIKHVVDTSIAPTAPTANDSGWDALATPAMSVDTSVDYYVGKAERDIYRSIYVYVWVKDSTERVSAASTANDDIEQTSPVLFVNSADHLADPLIKYQWHLRNTGQANFDSAPGTPGMDLNLQKTLGEYGIKGKGVLVNVIGGSFELAHEDMQANVDAHGGDDFIDGLGGPDIDPSPSADSGGSHGTSVAGLIGMRDANGIGGIGVAPESTLIGHNLVSYPSKANLARSIGADNSGAKSEQSDVINMSFDSQEQRIGLVDAYIDAIIKDRYTNGRNGKGVIFVQAAGNGYRSADGYDCALANAVGQSCLLSTEYNLKSLPLVVVAAVNASGSRSDYSIAGATNFISGFGGENGFSRKEITQRTGQRTNERGSIWEDLVPAYALEQTLLTADVQGCDVGAGYSRSYTFVAYLQNIPHNLFEYDYDASTRQPRPHADNPFCSYTSTFNGTSAAAPTVSGVVALILQANPNLTVWDVRYILANTARKIDGDYDVTTSVKADEVDYELSPGWITNAAGYHFSDWYGFGLIDADAAVEMALNYDVSRRIMAVDEHSANSGIVPHFIESGFTVSAETGLLDLTVPDKSTDGVSHSINFERDVTIDYVSIVVAADVALQDTQIELQSPSGTSYVVYHAANGLTGTVHEIYKLHPAQRMGTNAFFGESARGSWTISIKDLFDAASGGSDGGGTFYGWHMTIIGH